MKIRLDMIPDKIISQYNLHDIADNGWIYCEIKKGMYGLTPAVKTVNEQLAKHLAPYNYAPVNHTPGLWRHHTRSITFTLVVDNFGIKYTNIADIHHLQNSLRKQYDITTNMTGTLYCGLTLTWHYNKRYVNMSIFGHKTPSRPQYSPHKWERPIYGSPVQYTKPDSDVPRLPPPEFTCIQQIVGTLLYYAWAINDTMFMALNSIAAK